MLLKCSKKPNTAGLPVCYSGDMALTDIKKSIQLTTGPFEELLKNGQSLDFRLDQDVWKDLRAGDYIEFWEDATGWQKEPSIDARRAIVQIKHIYRAPSFIALFEAIQKDSISLGDTGKLLGGLRSWWSEDKEVCEGTLAFHVELVGKTRLDDVH